MPNINNNSFLYSASHQMQTEMLSSIYDAKYFLSPSESWNVTAFFSLSIRNINT